MKNDHMNGLDEMGNEAAEQPFELTADGKKIPMGWVGNEWLPIGPPTTGPLPHNSPGYSPYSSGEDKPLTLEKFNQLLKEGKSIDGIIKADGGGMRFNEEKNRLELIPPEWIWALGDVTTQGSKKYEARNWERGMKWSIMVGCALRHLMKFCMGEKYDPETGCHHLGMVAWNALALMSYDLREVGTNDVPMYDPEEAANELLKSVNSGKGTRNGTN